MTVSSLTSPRMPVLFLGHGSPMNALENNTFTRSWRALGQRIGKPRAILMVSAHWLTRGVAVDVNTQPETIHDFGAFPKALFDVRYPAPGAPFLAQRVAQLLQPQVVNSSTQWGLDHGTWSVLRHMYPEADVPIAQISIAVKQPLRYHYEIGQMLRPLRDEGVLIVGSGNVVHNLPRMDWMRPDAGFDWADRFQELVRSSIEKGEDERLIDYPSLGSDALQAIPSSDHYLPLLYVLGARDASDDMPHFETPQCCYGSLSMMSIGLWPSAWQTNTALAA